MHGIHRIDRDASRRHLWQVTIQRRNRIYTRNFPDLRHGGRDQALAAAQSYRDALLAQHPPLTRRAHCAILKKNNQSGVAGVTRIVSIDRRWKNVARAAYWVARWPGEGGTVKQRRFSVMKHGERGAFLKAVEARRHGLACLDDTPSSNQPTQD